MNKETKGTINKAKKKAKENASFLIFNITYNNSTKRMQKKTLPLKAIPCLIVEHTYRVTYV
jgi:hypothetical protein